jgi:hypothetical protein
MFCANLLLRAPVLVIFVTATRLLWPMPFDSRHSVQSYFAGEEVVHAGAAVGLRKKSNALVRSSSSSSTHNSTSAAIPARDESFRLDNLDLSVPILCGKKKCLFTLSSDPTIGYLLLASDGNDSKLRKLQVAWLYAKHLELHYKAKHLFLSEPKELKISTEFAGRLNGANLTRLEVNGESGTAPTFEKGRIVAQKVRVAPAGSLLVGCDRKFDHAVERLGDFVSCVKDRKSFVKKFDEQVSVMRDVLNVKENQCLLRDFQVLVDTKGNINQIDLDRCPLGSKYKKGFKEHVKKCTAQFDAFVRRCREAVLAT